MRDPFLDSLTTINPSATTTAAVPQTWTINTSARVLFSISIALGPMRKLTEPLFWLSLLPEATGFRFGLSVKTADNEFFKLSESGCLDYVTKFFPTNKSTCIYSGPVSSPENWNPDPDGSIQAAQIREMIDDVDALAISVRNATNIHEIIRDSPIPIITFDSDAPESDRISYIGTDNAFLGESMAKVAIQIRPTGGNYAVMISTESPNMLERANGFISHMESKNKQNIWEYVGTVNFERDLDTAIAQLKELAALDISVLGVAGSGIMWSDQYEATYNEIAAAHDMTIISADDLPVQIDFLSRGKVQGLVGQMPYEMGYLAAQTLHKLLEGETTPEIIGTNLITHLQVPLVLPELIMDDNLVGDLRYVGISLFCLIAALSLFLAYWTIRNRKLPAVNAAQPFFLYLVIVGVFVMGSAIIPLSLDDVGEPISPFRSRGICMSVPWVSCCGFTIVFSALFAKTFRITRILRAAMTFQRVTVTKKDVLLPMVILLSLNVLVLTLWTALDPLSYIRQDNPGTDGWNRTISTFGACRSRNALPYLLPLVFINLFCLGIANWQAYLARKIKSEFAESKYIGLAMAVFLQTMLIGLPVLFIVRNSPQSFYLTLCFILFVVCIMLLLLIFVPKIVLADKDEQTQFEAVQEAIRSSVPSQVNEGLRQRVTAVAGSSEMKSAPSSSGQEISQTSETESTR